MVKNILFRAGLSLMLLANSPICAHSDDRIFGATPQTAPITEAVGFDRLSDSPTMRDHGNEVIAAAEVKLDKMEKDGMISPAEKIQIKGWFKGLPFQRIIDVKLSFITGLPDLISLCLEANPIQNLSVDACAGSMVFLSGLSVHVASRFLHYVNINGKTNKDGSVSYSGNEFGVGPKVGYRAMEVSGIYGELGTATGIDALLSAEWVHWFSRYFGMGLTVDAGATFVVAQTEGANQHAAIPNFKLSLGISF